MRWVCMLMFVFALTPDSTTESNTSSGCLQADQFHPEGSSWHPYLPPNGFNLCIVMSCQSSRIKYTRVQCPPLKCAEKDAIRPDKNSCCKVCPAQEDQYARDQSVSSFAPYHATGFEVSDTKFYFIVILNSHWLKCEIFRLLSKLAELEQMMISWEKEAACILKEVLTRTTQSGRIV